MAADLEEVPIMIPAALQQKLVPGGKFLNFQILGNMPLVGV